MRLLRRTTSERTWLPRLEVPGAGIPRHCAVGSCCSAAATDRRAALSLRIFSGTPLQTNRSLEPLGRGLSEGHRVVRLLRHTDLLDRHWRRSCLDFDTRSKGNGGFFLSAYYGMPSFGFDAVVPLKGGKVIAEVPLTNLSLEIFGTF